MALKKVTKKKKLRPVKSFYHRWSKEEIEEFIKNSYTGEFNSKRNQWHNFPYKPEMKKYEVINSIHSLKLLVDYMIKNVPIFAFDTEASGLDAQSDNKSFVVACITISFGESNNYLIPLNFLRDEDIDAGVNLDMEGVQKHLRRLFGNPYVWIAGNNLKFDRHVLMRLDIPVKTEKFFDNQNASWIVDENTPNGLKENAIEKMRLSPTKFKEVTESIPNEIKKKFGYKANSKVYNFCLVLLDEGKEYALSDSFNSWCLMIGFRKEIIDCGMDQIFYEKMMYTSHVLFEMEEHGVTVDKEALLDMQTRMEKKLDELAGKIYSLAGCSFNINSTPQKTLLLYGVDEFTVPFEKYVEKYKKRNAKRIDKSGFDREKVRNTYESKQMDPLRMVLLDNCFHFPVTSYTGSGNPATDKDALWVLAHKEYKKNKKKSRGVEMCKYLLEYSKVGKLKTAFADGLLEQMSIYEDNRVHPNFKQLGTDSGRLSCASPNLQQLPKADEEDEFQIRSVFIGSEYVSDSYTGEYIADLRDFDSSLLGKDDYIEVNRKKIIAIDYHNLEMVILRHFSGDENLTEMFANDDDAHGSTAVNMFGLDCTPADCKSKYPHLRQAAKTLNFLLMYGGGAQLLYEKLKNDHYSPVDLGSPEYLKEYHCKSGVEVARVFIDKYFTTYSGVARFIRNNKKFAHRHGYVKTVLGRKRRLPDINSPDSGAMSYNERLAVNSPVQGTAGDITNSAQIRIFNEDILRSLGCTMLIQVHDEIVFECPENFLEDCIRIIKHDMEYPFGDDSPLNIDYLRADYDVGDSYQEAK